MVLTVGIAADPDHRFWKLEFCDHTEGMWLLIEVFWQGLVNQMCNLEVSVIAVVQSLPGLLLAHLADTAWAWSMLEVWFLTAETNVSNVGRAVRHRGESAVGIGARAASGGVGGWGGGGGVGGECRV
jgi:hypothetical protein